MCTRIVAPVISMLISVWSGTVASAQNVEGFATAGMGSTDYGISREYVPQLSGGLMLRLGDTRVALGGQADLLVSDGRVAGRGGPLVQVDLLTPRRRSQPFISGGYFAAAGEKRWVVGGGVDIRVTRRMGVRLAAQDALTRLTTVEEDLRERRILSHEPSLQAGFVFRWSDMD